MTHHTKFTLALGSSPLARGLLGVARGSGVGVGIIPARAGFTRRPRGRGGRHPDHPRSRGVYSERKIEMNLKTGSSPLARGLRRPAGRCRTCAGIIPARAGFTVHFRLSSLLGWDHPRSRGVYAALIHSYSPGPGSSPLARGLLSRPRTALGVPRIIPARAGFTFVSRETTEGDQDHPRSRGVYARARCAQKARTGSSPLARGLPRAPGRQRAAARIIPARAGFTHLLIPTIGRNPDHPRSRGVY